MALTSVKVQWIVVKIKNLMLLEGQFPFRKYTKYKNNKGGLQCSTRKPPKIVMFMVLLVGGNTIHLKRYALLMKWHSHSIVGDSAKL